MKEDHKEYETVEDFLPAGVKFPSSILNLEQLYRLYMWLDKFVRIRTPKLLYSTNEDGFSLSTLYMKTNPFKDDFKSLFFIIQTTNNEIFGAYIDQIITRNDTNFIENEKTFIFKLTETTRERYLPTHENKKFCYAGKDFICFGSGDGKEGAAAIYLNSTL